MWNHYCEVPMSPDKFRASLTTFLVLKTKTKNQKPVIWLLAFTKQNLFL